MQCAAHPDRETEKTCNECGKAICEECTRKVSENLYCEPCLEKAKQNLTSALQEMTKNINWVKAFAAGLVVAVIGAVVWEKVEIWFHLQLALVAIAIGYCVAFAVMWGAGGKRGLGLQILSLLLALFGIIGGFVLTTHDYLLIELAKGKEPVSQLNVWIACIIILPAVLIESGFLSWLIIGFGLYQSFIMPAMPKVALDQGASSGGQGASSGGQGTSSGGQEASSGS